MKDNKLDYTEEMAVKSLDKFLVLSIACLMLLFTASAEISQTRGPTGNLVFQNSTGETVLNLSEQGELKGFFAQGECASDEAIKTINPDGSYECNQISTTTQAEGLSETLAAGNVANQSINFDSSTAVKIGDSGTAVNDPSDVAIGKDADTTSITAMGDPITAMAIGSDAEASTIGGTVGGMAIGNTAKANYHAATALGISSKASNTGAVAIGYNANAPNQYEATFGNLNGQELDVNVTGNLTVHDSLEMPNGVEIGGEGTSAASSGSIALGKSASAADDQSVAIGQGATTSSGNLEIAIGSSSSASGSNSVAIGMSSSSSDYYSTALGRGAEATGQNAVAIGGGDSSFATAASSATNTGSVAIGAGSIADQQYTVELGSSSQAYDLKVNGGNLEFSDRVVIGGSDTSTSHSGDIAIGKKATVGGTGSSESRVGIGQNAEASLLGATAVGAQAQADKSSSSAFGYNARALGVGSSAFGYAAEASADGAVAIGANSVADQSNTVEIGSDSQSYDLIVNGDVSSNSADLAEIYSAERNYSAGTVVKISDEESDVEEASRFNDVAGVVSTDPGYVLNNNASGIEVALEGRVPVKVAESVEKGQDLAAGPDGKAVACSKADVSLSENANSTEIVEAVNSLSSNQECLSASFGEALNSSENGMVEVMLD